MTTIHSPLEQFQIKRLIDLTCFGVDISFTNASLFMVIATALICLVLWSSTRKRMLMPGKMQLIAEALHDVIESMMIDIAGPRSQRFKPFIFSLFMFILSLNLLGAIPYTFTVTSHIAVTFCMAILIFLGVTLLGFALHGLHYLELLLPKGTPILLAPVLVMIELFAYLARPISLSIRLTANMMAGHVVLKLIASLITIGGVIGFIPAFVLLTMLQGFEIFVAVLQAYIFTVLTCAYLSDAINLH
ncbi:F0F1 ATP synthase subunit A [Rickettsiales endosymbiont of Peranema trichophorum]|uniref:F0F1 ATP synthase subunit A n=1 Tax=Rickettsiales endosymbiont of Peranema trichophorum TaxID=2486577 RepID=UPI001022C871|nr:F0F1 ATP synthase subunit A [Rickettsiales endosymbiont of Peranema trichophorum]RZI47521.1 F0F1 ATP synthase subunit A [Rickettsiales endosymbiont of Peranema trichophorum]